VVAEWNSRFPLGDEGDLSRTIGSKGSNVSQGPSVGFQVRDPALTQTNAVTYSTKSPIALAFSAMRRSRVTTATVDGASSIDSMVAR